jgi:hypothetical protein
MGDLLFFVGLVVVEIVVWEIPRYLARRCNRAPGIFLCVATSTLAVASYGFAVGISDVATIYARDFVIVAGFTWVFLTVSSCVVYMYELTNHDTTTAGQKPGILATWLQKHRWW